MSDDVIHSTGATIAGALAFGIIGALVTSDDVDQRKWKLASRHPDAYIGIGIAGFALVGGLIARSYSAKPNPAALVPTSSTTTTTT